MTNPYSAPRGTDASPRPRPRLLRAAMILNATLIAIPLGLGVAAYVWSQLSIAWEAARSTGDPVAFQHFYWIDPSPWFVMAYFLIPNAILLATYGDWNPIVRHDEPENRNEG